MALMKQRSRRGGSSERAQTEKKMLGQSLGEVLEWELPTLLPRVDPWLNSGESCLLYGGSGAGKSLIAMTIALGISGGGKALGWDFPHPCKTVFVDGEQGRHDIQTRFKTLGHTVEGRDSALSESNLSILARTATPPEEEFFDLLGGAATERFVRAWEKAGVGFVILDNLSTLSPTLENENDAAEFKPLQAFMSQLKAADISALLVHHAGKNAKGDFRGSSNIITTFERSLSLEPAKGTGLTVKLELKKFRAKPPPRLAMVACWHLASEDGSDSAQWEPANSAEGTHSGPSGRAHLEQSWALFVEGGFRTIAEYVKKANALLHTTRHAGSFRRDFTEPWIKHLGKTPADIAEVRTSMRQRPEPQPQEPA